MTSQTAPFPEVRASFRVKDGQVTFFGGVRWETLGQGIFFFKVFCKNTGQHDLCLACTPAISGFPLERVFYISIPALIKKLLYSRGLRELAGSLLSSSVSGRHSAFGNQMSSLLPGWGLSSNFIVVTEWLSPSGKHLILSSASAPLLICFGQVTQFAFNGVSPPVEIFFFIFLCTHSSSSKLAIFDAAESFLFLGVGNPTSLNANQFN